LAPGGLTERERAESDRSYKYQYRNKELLTSPYVEGGSAAPSGELAPAQPLNEDEKLYRYFGAATSLYKQGKTEEAIEILNYILEKDPGNGYVKNYLQKISCKNKLQESQYKAKAKNNAILFNKQKVRTSLQDGIDYYKQKKYDLAMVEFSDVLEIDPGNMQAQHYMKLLKERYAKANRIERMVDEQESALTQSGDEEALLDKAERKISSSDTRVTDSLLDEAEVKAFARGGKTEELLDQAELALTVDDIVARQKEEEAKTDKMTFNSGDILGILVYDHPELSGRVTVDGTGNVILPLVNEPVNLKGLTADEAIVVVQDALKTYVKDPSATVELLSSSKIFYFIDEVSCTPFPINRPNFTLRDALFLSDWGNNRALGRVIVIKADKLYPVVKKIDAFDLIYRGNLANNIKIDDGDVIYVPMTIVGKTTQTVNDTVAPFQAIQTARDQWLDAKWSQKGLKSYFRIYPDRQEMPQTVNGNSQ
jgi:protein involved in polysaccharide export with SLBB domain